MCDEKRFDIAIRRCLVLGERSVIFAESLILGYVRIKINQVFQIRNAVGQCANGKVFACERLQHKHFTLTCLIIGATV